MFVMSIMFLIASPSVISILLGWDALGSKSRSGGPVFGSRAVDPLFAVFS